MLWLALPAVAVAWLLQFFNAQPLLALPSPAWAGLALLTWCALGGRAALVVFAAGWTLVRADWLIEQRLPASLAGRDIIVRGMVCDFPRADPQATRLALDREAEPGGATWPDRIHLSWYDDAPPIRPGQRWQLRVRLKPPHGLVNPGAFDFEQWLFVRGIGATGHVRKSPLNALLPATAWECPVGVVRNDLATRIEAAVGAHPAAGYVLGVAVGATHRLTDADWDLLRRTGTTHLLAISGLNIAMVAAPFLLAGPLLGRIWRGGAGRPHLGVVPAVVAAACYSALAGFAISTVRALVMLCIAAALAVQRRRVEGIELLGAAAIAVLILDPAAVISASFWLSFLAVAWLFLAAVSPARIDVQAGQGCGASNAPWWRVWRAGVGLGRTQIILGLGLAPLTVAWFHQVSLIAPLTNLVAVPVFSLAVMPLTLVGSALLVPAPPAGAWLLGVAADVVQYLLGFLRFASVSGPAVWEPPWSNTVGLALALPGIVILCWWRPVPLRPLALAWLLPVLVGTRTQRPEIRVTVMDVGQGLAVLIETARHSLLYDAGPAFRMRDAGESIVLPVLRNAGVDDLDAVMISHNDQDHRGGAGTVLQVFPRARLIAPAAMGLAAERFEPCEAGLVWQWDGVRFQVISPDPVVGWQSDNDGSCVLRVEASRASLLLPGDIERGREQHLVQRGLLPQVDVVIAPHHGSRSSSSPPFVTATRPRILVFSAGHLNRWGFPAPAVVRRWAQSGACLLNTADSGAIVLGTAADGAWRVLRRERVDGAHLWTSDEGDSGACAVDADQ